LARDSPPGLTEPRGFESGAATRPTSTGGARILPSQQLARINASCAGKPIVANPRYHYRVKRLLVPLDLCYCSLSPEPPRTHQTRAVLLGSAEVNPPGVVKSTWIVPPITVVFEVQKALSPGNATNGLPAGSA